MPYIRILLTLTLFFLSGAVHAQVGAAQRMSDMKAGIRYDESVFLVSNYSVTNTSPAIREQQSVSQLLECSVEGFYFYLKRDDKSANGIQVRQPDGTFTDFRPILDDIRQALDKDSLKFMTLFLDFNVEIRLDEIFEKSGLAGMMSIHKDGESWPLLSEAVKENKRLTIFEVTKHVNSPSWMNVMDKDVEHTDTSWGNYSRMPESSDNRLKHTLSLYTGYRLLATQNISEDQITEMARHTPYFIESFREYWIRDGRLPNFVLIDRYYTWMEALLMNVRSYSMVYGMVSGNNEPVSYVNWDEMSNATTGNYCFPIERGSELMLAPIVPGYSVEPQKAYVQGNERKVSAKPFTVTPLAIGEDIELLLPLEDEVPKDMSAKRHKLTAENISSNFETRRGQHTVFGNGSRICLPPAAEMNIRDHDFTVSVWIKIPEYLPDKEDYCIIGARNSAYQHGMHLIVRNQKPFMGFFNNDLQGNTTIEPNTWYNIIWRYNKSNGEQAIYVDGKLDAISLGRPPYMGSDSLYVGCSNNNQQTEPSRFIGMMDNLCIWSRVLSDKEILGISSQIIDISAEAPDRGSRRANILLALVAVAVVFTIGWSIVVRRMQVKQSKAAALQHSRQEHKTAAASAMPASAATSATRQDTDNQPNSIKLFGEFKVTDKDGEDITQLFTPKLKQLFMLLLLHSTNGNSGIAGNDISENIWGDKDSKNIRNLRSVSILKLRKILDRMDKVEVCYIANKYSLRTNGTVRCDYVDSLDMLANKRIGTREDLEQFYDTVSRGEIFKGESFDWMDDAKSHICNSIVDTLTKLIRLYDIAGGDADKAIKTADQILLNDPCNEEALYFKVKALIHQDNAKSAQYAYHKFCSLYEQMYGEAYKTSFDGLVAKGENEVRQDM